MKQNNENLFKEIIYIYNKNDYMENNTRIF